MNASTSNALSSPLQFSPLQAGLLPRPFVETHVLCEDGGVSSFIVDSRYQSLKYISHGSYGIVVEARDLLSNRKVVIKKIPRVFEDLVDAKRIVREVIFHVRMKMHSNILELLDIMLWPQDFFTIIYLVTEYYPTTVEALTSSLSPHSIGHDAHVEFSILRGLASLHSQSGVHRDLKASNILLKKNTDAVLCDFGLARTLNEDPRLRGNMSPYVVTRWYRPPEILLEVSNYSAASDIWSLGCVFAEFALHRPLFKGHTTRSQLQQIIRILGPPPDSYMRAVNSSVLNEIASSTGSVESRLDWDLLAECTSPEFADLLRKMLVFDPSERITLDEARTHAYFLQSTCERPLSEPVQAQRIRVEFDDVGFGEVTEEVLRDAVTRVRAEFFHATSYHDAVGYERFCRLRETVSVDGAVMQPPLSFAAEQRDALKGDADAELNRESRRRALSAGGGALPSSFVFPSRKTSPTPPEI